MELLSRSVRVGCAVLVAIGLTGCIRPELVACGDESCPFGNVCTPGGCASPDSVVACQDLGEGAACVLSGFGHGTCIGGACRTGLCGNGVLDPGELCDGSAGVDAASGQVCSADCEHMEVCGNGIVDPGEQCDDGNTNAVDGCDACVLTTWTASVSIGEGSLAGGALTDPQAVAFDGQGNLFIADSWAGVIRRLDKYGHTTTVAATASFGVPYDVVTDGVGNLYTVDEYGCRVQRVATDGTVTTVAGTGACGYNGDGMLATSAMLNYACGVAVDGLGNLYIADTYNQRIRRVDTTGVITTVAGTGTSGYNGDGISATTATLATPYTLRVDRGGNLFIADTGNNRIRRVDAQGTITTVAGTGAGGGGGDSGLATAAQLAAPNGVAVDGAGNLYIADTGNNRVRHVDAFGVITTLAGTGVVGFAGDTGPASSALLSAPAGVVVAPTGAVYVADTGNNRIRRVDTQAVITTVAGNGQVGFYTGDGGAATAATLFQPAGLVFSASGELYITTPQTARVLRVDAQGVIETIAGTGASGSTGDGGPASTAQVSSPAGITFDPSGNLFIASYASGTVRRIDTNGIITTIAGTGTNGYGGDGGPATSAQLNNPGGMAADGAGNLYIADELNNRVRKINASGIITTVAGNGGGSYGGDNGPATSALLNSPQSVALDAAGNLYIADFANSRIRKVDTTGTITTVAGNGVYGASPSSGGATQVPLQFPFDVKVGAAGDLYIADWSTYSNTTGRVVHVDPMGNLTTIAGALAYGISGDGGPVSAAHITDVQAIAVDGGGNVYFADQYSNRVRRVDPAGRITTIAGPVDPAGTGPLATAHLEDPMALVTTPDFTLFADAASGTVARTTATRLDVVAGRYPQDVATGTLARFRDRTFGKVYGVAYDAGASKIYLTESSANRVDVVTMVDPANAETWTIAPLANVTGAAGYVDGAAATARFRDPRGLYLDTAGHQLYIADKGNHVVRAIDLGSRVVRTVAGIGATLGEFGDGLAATDARLYEPQAVTMCPDGDLFIADTGNNRVRRVAAQSKVISTVLGVGVGTSSGEGAPATSFPVDTPLGLACDALGNLFVTSTDTVRLLPADATGVVDGSGVVETIYGKQKEQFPETETACLTGVSVIDATQVEVVDACTGLAVVLHRVAAP